MELNQETLKKAYNYLSKDSCLKFLIKRFSDEIDISERYNENYAKALAFLVIEQQVSFKAAITIKKRFSDKVNNLSDVEILNLEITDLQSIGISLRKAHYIQNVYKYFQDSNFDFKSASNKDIISEFIKIVKDNNMICGLSGSLKFHHIKELKDLDINFLGFRGELCSRPTGRNFINISQVEKVSYEIKN